MSSPGEQLAAILAEQRERPNVIGETVCAILAGNIIDNTPITSVTIGPLMAAHAAELEAEASGGDQ